MIYKKIFIWETELIIALDIMNTLSNTDDYAARIIKHSEDLNLLLIEEKPDVFIICSNMIGKIEERLASLLKILDIPLLILTTFSDDDLIKRINNISYNLLAKPFSNEELLVNVRKCINKKIISAESIYRNNKTNFSDALINQASFFTKKENNE